MKQTLISILLLKATLLNCISIQAQNDKTTGIYSTANDFRSGILIKKIDCNSNNKIRVNNFFGTTDITVKENNIVTKIKKSAVYGYKSCKNENYRFYNNEEFKIIDTGGIYIYSEYHYENPVKGKGAPIKMEGFHYSITPEGEIYPLTKESVLNNYPDNLQLRLWLKGSSSKPGDLLERDAKGRLVLQLLIKNQR